MLKKILKYEKDSIQKYQNLKLALFNLDFLLFLVLIFAYF